ncbi:HIT family protein [Catellatospora sichuanensis]|uniref:HIT family protein n=1 Tax=Catellatospora sichuanensis TaxID=1969805 RepID=UPI001182558B|nr:HIT family protein [Catellatospora sichuanensis]
MDECVLCLRALGKEFWIPVAESDHTIAALANHQRSHGALLVVPRRHTSTIAELTADEATDHFRLVQRMAEVLTQAYRPDGINVWQGGRMPEARFNHVHTHVCPRYVDAEYSFVASEDLPLPSVEQRWEIARQILEFVPSGLAVRSAG